MSKDKLSQLSTELSGVLMDVENTGEFDQVCYDTVAYVIRCLNNPELIETGDKILLGEDFATLTSHCARRIESLGLDSFFSGIKEKLN